MRKVTVLGGGMVGGAIALDLCSDFNVQIIDADQKRLSFLAKKAALETTCLNINNRNALKEAVKSSDLVIGAVPGFMGFEVLKTVIDAGKDIVDISFFEEDAFRLDELAKQKNVTVITDCGVAPGMMNIILGYYNSRTKVNEFITYVGGLPFKRKLPFQYKAPFSPADVIEIYTRPARLMEDGKLVTKPAMSDREFLDLPQVGTLEAFNTDGLRSLLHTMKVPNMKEKTLRYPGHLEYIEVLKASGFFSEDPVNIDGHNIKPIDLTTRLLFPMWKLEDGEDEFTIMRVIIRAEDGGRNLEYRYDLFDRYNSETGISSMARTTGFTCSAAARLVLNGNFKRKGICPPEYLGEDQNNFTFIMKELEKRGVNYVMTEEAPVR